MKHLLHFIITLMLAIPFTVTAQDGTWVPVANFTGQGNIRAVSLGINGKGYVGTGYSVNTGSYTQEFWQYDPATGSWSQMADFGAGGRDGAMGFTIGNKGYIGLGYTFYGDSWHNDLWEYDPETNIWTKKADFPGYIKYGGAAFSVNSKGYFCTGIKPDESGVSKECWEYDPANDTWTRKADFPGPDRFETVGLGIGDKGYVGTGTLYAGQYQRLNDFWEFDPVANTWTQKANVGGDGRWMAAAFTLNGKGYIGGGGNSNRDLSDVWSYDPASDIWTQVDNFPRTISEGTAFTAAGNAYMGLGELYQTDFFQFDPEHTLHVDSISASIFCKGSAVNITVPYTAKGNFDAANTFTVQLFDRYNYYFHDTVNIGSINATTSGIINAVIPDTLPTGDYYTIRIISSAPGLNSDVYTGSLSVVDPQISVSPNINNPVCSGNAGSVDLSVSGGDGNYQYLWYDNSTQSSHSNLSAGTYSVTVTDPGCSVSSQDITLVNAAPQAPDVSTFVRLDSTVITIDSVAGAGSYEVVVLYQNLAYEEDTILRQYVTANNLSTVVYNLQPSSSYYVLTKSFCPGLADSSDWRYNYFYTPCVNANPAEFGNNTWNVYAYSSGDDQDYGYSWISDYFDGYYTEDTVSFDTRTRWNAASNPSTASGYVGCGNVYDDYHSWSAKRKGFPCGKYIISIPGHDDEAQLFINDSLVWQHIGCCDSHDSVWIGELNDTSRIDFRTTEGGGDSYGAILFQPVKPAIIAPADTTVEANNTSCTATNIALGQAVISPACGTITNDAPAVFAVGTTTVTWTVTDGNGDTAQAIQHVTVTGLARPARPGFITGRKNYLCGGGTFTYSIMPVPGATGYIWQAPAGFIVANYGTSADITIPSNLSETAVISVAATNACATSQLRKTTLYAIAPPLHSTITGPAAVAIKERGVIYKVAKRAGITYTWSVPAGAIIKSGQGTNRIRVNFGNASGYINVNASNACDPGKEIAQLYVTVGDAAIAATLPSGANGLTVFPNPTQAMAKLVFNSADDGIAYTITVTDIAGKVLQTKTGITTEGNNIVNIDLSKYAGGVYIIRLTDAETSKSISVVKER